MHPKPRAADLAHSLSCVQAPALGLQPQRLGDSMHTASRELLQRLRPLASESERLRLPLDCPDDAADGLAFLAAFMAFTLDAPAARLCLWLFLAVAVRLEHSSSAAAVLAFLAAARPRWSLDGARLDRARTALGGGPRRAARSARDDEGGGASAVAAVDAPDGCEEGTAPDGCEAGGVVNAIDGQSWLSCQMCQQVCGHKQTLHVLQACRHALRSLILRWPGGVGGQVQVACVCARARVVQLLAPHVATSSIMSSFDRRA